MPKSPTPGDAQPAEPNFETALQRLEAIVAELEGGQLGLEESLARFEEAVKLLGIPYRVLYPAILFLISIGVYSVNNSSVDVLLTLVFGLFGFWFNRHGFPAAPLLLGFVLGPLLEENFRRALLLSDGQLLTFVQRPVSLAFLLFTLGVLVAAAWSSRRRALRQGT